MQGKVKDLKINWTALGLSLIVSVAVGLSVAAMPLDRMIEAAIGRLAWRPVSGDTVVVALDERTLERYGRADFATAQHAQIVDAVNAAGARRLFIDFIYDRRETDRDFPALTGAVKRMGDRVVLAVEAHSSQPGASRFGVFPSPDFGPSALRGCIGWQYEFWQVWRLPAAVEAGGITVTSFSSLLADKPHPPVALYALDYSYDTDSIASYSAIDVLQGKVGRRELAGKDVIFGATAQEFQDTHYLPGHDKVPGAFIHVIGGETLKRGNPVDIGWLPVLLLAAGASLAATIYRGGRRFSMIAAAAVSTLVLAKILLSMILVAVSIGPSLVLIAAIGIHISRRRRRESAQHHNPVSGLLNFEALRSQAPFGTHSIVAAKLINFDSLSAFLPGEGSKLLVEQVARRLQLASQSMTLHHDPHGSFAWLVPYYQHSQIEEQLAGLAALFNAPLTIGDQRIDVSIAFGVNDEFEGSNDQRLAAALLAAEQAIHTRSLWTRYRPREQHDAGWELSFHSQLEDALAGGDIWVAFQPQYEIATQRLVGLEALARWTHPTRGPIPPDQFIVQAEKSQDIYRLTLFVMDKAIEAAAQLRAQGIETGISVNLSAALLDLGDLVQTICAMLTAHQLPPELLTIEITETAQIEDSRLARTTLAQLRQVGCRLSIDDYGTGQSNLEYLTEIEADEIKIDKKFVMTMCDSQRNLEVVKSTIDLAHRLGVVAVAEGIEDAPTMALLGRLGCDVGQGYHLGKPQIFSDLLATLTASPYSRSA